MTIYYVNPAAIGTADGLTKENAFLTLQAAVAVATGVGDEIRCIVAGQQAYSADVTFTIQSPRLRIVCWDFTTDTPATLTSAKYVLNSNQGAYQTTWTYYTEIPTKTRHLLVQGLEMFVGGASTDHLNLFTASSGCAIHWESCSFYLLAGTRARINIGGGSEYDGAQKFTNCAFTIFRSTQYFVVGDHKISFINCSFSGANGAYLFAGLEQGPDLVFNHCTFFVLRLKILQATTGTRVARLQNCTRSILDITQLLHEFPTGSSTSGEWDPTVINTNTRLVVNTPLEDTENLNQAILNAKYGGVAFWYSVVYLDPYNNLAPSLPAIYTGTSDAGVSGTFYPLFDIALNTPANSFTLFFLQEGPGSSDAFRYSIGFFPEVHNIYYEGPMDTPTGEVVQIPSEEEVNLPAELLAYRDEFLADGHFVALSLQLEPGKQITSLTVEIRLNESAAICPYFTINGVFNPTPVKILGDLWQEPGSSSPVSGDPLPAYPALIYYDGHIQETQISEPLPAGAVPVIWTGSQLRTLAPGEGIVVMPE
mgnify:CR=1 FL=1